MSKYFNALEVLGSGCGGVLKYTDMIYLLGDGFGHPVWLHFGLSAGSASTTSIVMCIQESTSKYRIVEETFLHDILIRKYKM